MSLSSPSRRVFLWTDSMRPKSAASSEIHPAVTLPLSTQTFFSMIYFRLSRLRSTKPTTIKHDPISRKISGKRLFPIRWVEQAEDRYTGVLRNNQTDTGG